MKAAELAEPVARLLDPQNRGRQYVAAALGRLDGTRTGGFVLTTKGAVGKWGAASYAVQRTAAPLGPETAEPYDAPRPETHRGHRDHRDGAASYAPYGSYGFPAAERDGDAEAVERYGMTPA